MDPGNPNVRLPESSKPHSHRRRRRPRPTPAAPASDVDPFTAGASRPPARDAGADSIAAPGHPPSQQTYYFQSMDGRRLGPVTPEFFFRAEEEARARRSRPSSSAAPPSEGPPSDHTEVGRRRSARRVRQSVLYSAPRQTQRTEHRDLEEEDKDDICVEQRMGRLGVSSARYSEGFSDDVSQEQDSSCLCLKSPGAIKPVTGHRIRQSALYSNRPRRPRHRQVTAPTKEHPSEMTNNELSKVTDLPTLEALSLRDTSLLIPQTDDYEDDAYGQATHEELAAVKGSAELGPLRSDDVLPRSDSSLSPKATEENLTDSDNETEEILRLISESRAGPACTSFTEGCQMIMVSHHAYLTEQAAKNGTEPPPPLPAKRLPVDQKTQSLQAHQQPSAAAQPQHNTAPREPRCEASNAELAENAEKWMREEVKMVFEKYIEARRDLKGHEFCFDELRHQCFNVEHYNKSFHHYNFTARVKEPNSSDWVVALYFAEVKQMFGRKDYFCCHLEPFEKGHCYACKSQGVEDLQHPIIGGFENGVPYADFGLWYE